MKQTIYVDVLLCMNLFINYFILLATARFLRQEVTRKRLLLGAALGAVYSLTILFPPINAFLSVFIKLLMSVTIVLASFGIRESKSMLKMIACFYSISFAFCGAIFAVWYFLAPKGVMIQNGIVYFNISPLILLVATVCSYFIIRVISRITGRQMPKDLFCEVKIGVGQKNIRIKAKIDTGNSLIEPFSHLPVIVVEYHFIEDLIPEEVRSFFLSPAKMQNSYETLKKWDCPCRLIPFQVVSESGVLPAFRPDQFCLIQGNQAVEKSAYVAVCSAKMLGNEFMALINPELIEN